MRAIWFKSAHSSWRKTARKTPKSSCSTRYLLKARSVSLSSATLLLCFCSRSCFCTSWITRQRKNSEIIKNHKIKSGNRYPQWLGWPDHGIPMDEHFPVIQKICNIITSVVQRNSSPVIHCRYALKSLFWGWELIIWSAQPNLRPTSTLCCSGQMGIQMQAEFRARDLDFVLIICS